MRSLSGPVGVAVSLWTAITILIHLYYAAFGFLEPLPQRALHLMPLVAPVFLLFPARRDGSAQPTAPDWLLATLSLPPHLYVFLNARELLDRTAFVDPPETIELVFGTLATLLVVEATRRALSATLAIMVAVVVGYLFVCHLMPGIWYYRPLPYAHIIDILYLVNNSGLYGFLTGISAGIVILLFIAFGALSQASGLGELFHNLGLVVAGRFSGGPAKVEVVGSALFGTISGSSVANVVVTGTLTIPLMIRRGFRPTLAGGIEAASSVGGAIMPPVMGAASFVMAETIGVPYFEIAKAAALGALLQVPMVEATLPAGRTAGVLTYAPEALNAATLAAVGVRPDIAIGGFAPGQLFRDGIAAGRTDIARDAIEAGVVQVAKDLLARQPAIGAIVCECTNLAPFSAAIRDACDVPVYDVVSLIEWFHAGLRPRPYA